MKKIKLEYIDKTIVQKDGILGNRKIVVATIDPKNILITFLLV